MAIYSRQHSRSVGYDVHLCLLICLFVCLSVCVQHNSKTNYSKVFKLGIGNDLGIFWFLEMMWFWGWKVKGQGHRVDKCIFTLMFILYCAYVNAHLTDKSDTVHGGFELYECLLVLACVLLPVRMFLMIVIVLIRSYGLAKSMRGYAKRRAYW